MKSLTVIFYLMFSSAITAQSIVQDRLSGIMKDLDTMLFVKRFESVQTPCLCINADDNTLADAKRTTINSNYRIRLHADSSKIDSGIACLNRFYSRYVRFFPTGYDTINQTISGKVLFTYGYPAGSIIQYLGFTHGDVDASKSFFNKLISSRGTFKLYPEDDKYRIQVSLYDKPYNKNDTIFGYVEVVKGVFGGRFAFNIFFDAMNVHGGDNNNQIFLKFTSTSFNYESQYYTVMLYNVLKFENSLDISKRAEATWTKSFFSNAECPQCNFIYKQAELFVKSNVFMLPNTEPAPAH